ncbi:MAG TPA: ribosomal protein S18-alanine N-acetyltransferase [Patescibacteria group bacterium]|nr:ribosomal protein S18-alanine N-acetyltransferase [Patescibacteria group bacterium]
MSGLETRPEIRTWQPEDLDDILEVEVCSFHTPWSRQAFEEELFTNELACYLVLIYENRVVGYAGMWMILDEGHVTNVALHPEYRGRGWGAVLMEALMDAARQRGASCMTLEVRPSNQVALKMYESFGFIRKGVRSGYYSDTGEDALIMWRDDLLLPLRLERGG